MALYRCTSSKKVNSSGEVFTNVYTVEETSALEALDVLNTIQLLERNIWYNTIQIFKAEAVNVDDSSDRRSGGGVGNGELDPTGLGGPLPLFCTVRVTFTDNVKKPEQKYLRLGAQEANLTLGLWDGEFIDFIKENYSIPLLAQSQYVGPSGEAHTDVITSNIVQNRQIGWHRRFRPGFKRGWVPV